MNRGEVDQKIEAVFAGDVNRWLIDLTPPIGEYLAALRGLYEAPLIGARDSAARRGRDVWGVKYPRWPAPMIQLLRALIPRGRWIYIHRDIEPCLRSAKARGEVQTAGDAASYAQEWSMNLGQMLAMPPDERFLIVDYADLARDREAFLRRIEEHSGAGPIDRSVLSHRVNDSEGYLQPVELTEQEAAIARRAGSHVGRVL